MSCTAKGLFFLQRQRPKAGPGRTGAFGLLLHVNTDTSTGAREAYAALWKGADAEAFWRANEDRLTPGQPLELELRDLRAGHTGDRPGNIVTHIAAEIVSCRLMPRSTEVPRPGAAPEIATKSAARADAVGAPSY
ncbi:hypothetical protein [uncultured Xylophilus sp.]|uniref:hypothetical protein n=1 Tax=uncultured Xylophilus sp. TaxID=296832 RepID=UPI0025DFBD56|nr:hypothetical protein [uncultured Xylophilus sp.]